MSEIQTYRPSEAITVNADQIPDSALLPQMEQQKPANEQVKILLSEADKLTTIVDRYHFGPQANEARAYDLTQEGKKQLAEYSDKLKDADLTDIIEDYLYLANKDSNGKPNAKKREETLQKKTVRERMAKIAEARMRYRVQDIVSNVPSDLIQDIIGDYYTDGETNAKTVSSYLHVAKRLAGAKIDLPKNENKTVEKAGQDPRFAGLRARIMDLSLTRVSTIQTPRYDTEVQKGEDYLTVAQHLADVKADMKHNPNPPSTVEDAKKRASYVDVVVQKIARQSKRLSNFVSLAAFVIGNIATPHPEVPVTQHKVIIVDEHTQQMNIDNAGIVRATPTPDRPITHKRNLSVRDEIRLENRAQQQARQNEHQTTAHEMEEVVMPGQFGDILLGTEKKPAPPIFMMVTIGDRVLKGVIIPKLLQTGESHEDDYRKPYNVNYADGDGSMVQTWHSGESADGKKQWPGEEFRKFIEEEGTSPEDQLKKLTNADSVVLIQGNVAPEFMPTNMADPDQVQRMLNQVGVHGEGVINPVVQDAEFDFAAHMNPQETTSYGVALQQAPADAPASVTRQLGLDEERLGRLTLFSCGTAVGNEVPVAGRKADGQTRNVLGLKAVKPVSK